MRPPISRSARTPPRRPRPRRRRAAALAECNAKFAGRRKPGGGYTYYDFMQNRSFDIAGPNPTPEEQRKIDRAIYRVPRPGTAQQHRRRVRGKATAATIAEGDVPQRDRREYRCRCKRPTGSRRPRTSVARRAPNWPTARQHSFSCEWPRLSESINDLKKALFGSAGCQFRAGGKAKRGQVAGQSASVQAGGQSLDHRRPEPPAGRFGLFARPCRRGKPAANRPSRWPEPVFSAASTFRKISGIRR